MDVAISKDEMKIVAINERGVTRSTHTVKPVSPTLKMKLEVQLPDSASAYAITTSDFLMAQDYAQKSGSPRRRDVSRDVAPEYDNEGLGPEYTQPEYTPESDATPEMNSEPRSGLNWGSVSIGVGVVSIVAGVSLLFTGGAFSERRKRRSRRKTPTNRDASPSAPQE